MYTECFQKRGLMYQTTALILLYILILAFLFGAVFGSYIDCVAWRLVHHERVARGRSHCDVCGHALGARDLIPIISYLRSGGRCRYCGAKFSAESTWVELALGLAFAAIVYKFDVSFVALRYLGLLVILMGLSLVDQKTCIIPDRFHVAGILWWLLTLPLIACTQGRGLTEALSITGARLPLANAPGLQDGLDRIMLAAAGLPHGSASITGNDLADAAALMGGTGAAISAQAGGPLGTATAGTSLATGAGSVFTTHIPITQWILTDLKWGLISAFGVGLLMLLISLVFDKLTGKESLGGGDIKLLFMTGLYMRPGVTLFNLMLSCFVGLFIALGLKKDKIPFGPSISIAVFLSILFGSEFVAWYTGLIL